ncbi:MAG TPA: hypothetical protein VMU84_15240 [Thermoanaerobaculia bacterium]|nr:hypothetical protein [Thermoanaerobaculia bacterium]
MKVTNLIAAVWLGSGVFLMLAASAAFRAAGNSTTAADVVGAMLARWHYIALGAPLVLFALSLRHARPFLLGVLFVAILLAASQIFIDLRIRAIRVSSPVPISSLDRTDPVRKHFGRLHALSSSLLLLQAIASAIVVVVRKEGG